MPVKQQSELESLQTQVSEMEAAIAILETVPTAQLRNNSIHELLKAELDNAATEGERIQKLDAARAALAKAQARIAELEQVDEAARDEQMAKAAETRAAAIAAEINELSSKLWILVNQYQELPLTQEGEAFHRHHRFSVARILTPTIERQLPHTRSMDCQSFMEWMGRLRFEELEDKSESPEAS